ncbi:nitrilase-related carbon-nitrogen hydrolase [Leptospira yasudae]|uniref:Carbon-nitrogen hydrolase n=1 Tax=Leptospira yasudae TaxID=2202201 RepID=A0A6N4QTP9_9LEPT|nr:nitrilase-related carbon-nitrogen hydrolase [Leptospira yasudae]TGL77636.1 carbon-nitrogen hydrolase [Leptospira yasudae]TGL82749.1 carbon-nitrogen hydrolase [Leptospira yasudae]TGL86095.1 carbon-nitrogen hydrolase [Leptospira yasudae]
MRFLKRYPLPILLLFVLFHTIWSFTGRSHSTRKPDLRLERIESFGMDTNQGNLLGVQPWMTPNDYSKEENFRNKIESYIETAQKRGFLNPKTIVVFPEYLGTWLVVAEEKESVVSASKIEEAMRTLVLSNVYSFVWNLFHAKGKDSVRDALFRMKSEKMASIYTRTFSELARKYKITIVAGSILLPEPSVVDGVLKVGNGALKNGSFVFSSDGRVVENSPLKIYPIEDEKPFVEAAPIADLKVSSVPAGIIGVLVCADSWFPEVYDTFKKQNVDFVLVPSYVAPDNAMAAVWKGYNGASNPKDVLTQDIDRITEGEAWLKYALGGRMSKSGATHGINVFLRGSLWDLGSDGETIWVKRSTAKTFPRIHGASIVNLWID